MSTLDSLKQTANTIEATVTSQIKRIESIRLDEKGSVINESFKFLAGIAMATVSYVMWLEQLVSAELDFIDKSIQYYEKQLGL